MKQSFGLGLFLLVAGLFSPSAALAVTVMDRPDQPVVVGTCSLDCTCDAEIGCVWTSFAHLCPGGSFCQEDTPLPECKPESKGQSVSGQCIELPDPPGPSTLIAHH